MVFFIFHNKMARNYLTLDRYDGSLTGIEGRIPVYSSHSWENEGENTVSDLFIDKGDRSLSGLYGHFYGPSTHVDLYGLPDTRQPRPGRPASGRPYQWRPKKIEKFIPADANFELVENDDEMAINNLTPKKTISTYTLFFILLMAFIAFDFWCRTAHMFLEQHVHNGKTISWKTYIFYSVIIVLLLFCFVSLLGVPLERIETSPLVSPL